MKNETVMNPNDCRTKEQRLWEINRMLNTGMYRTGTLTELVNTKHALEREIADEKNKPL